MSNIPQELGYTSDHEWVSTSDGKVGITEYAANSLGDVVYVQLPEVGATITAGDAVGEIESTKSVSDIFAPVTGTVEAINQAVADDPSLINDDPYGEGWLFRVTLDGDAELLSAEDYAKLTVEGE